MNPFILIRAAYPSLLRGWLKSFRHNASTSQSISENLKVSSDITHPRLLARQISTVKATQRENSRAFSKNDVSSVLLLTSLKRLHKYQSKRGQ